MKTCWVTGAGGLIGSHIVRLAPPGWRVVPLTRSSLDLGDFAAIRVRFNAEQPEVIVHCAAISKAADCEQNAALAHRINCEATRVLAELGHATRLLFFSTDLVFDGHKGACTEADEPNPLTVYGETKLAAEQAVLANPLHTVIRASVNGGTSPHGDRSFTEQLVNAWKAGRAPKLFADEFRSPIMAAVTARAVWEILAKSAAGLYHLGGAERLSRYEIGLLLAARVPELRPKIERSSLRDYPGPPRAPDTSLDSSKIQRLLTFRLPRFSEWLGENWPANSAVV